MNRQIRRVAVVVLVGFMALLAAPLYWQVLAAPRSMAGHTRYPSRTTAAISRAAASSNAAATRAVP